MEKDFKIFDDKNFSDLSKEIYENSKLKKTQIDLFIQEVHGYIQSIEDVAIVGPVLKELFDVAVKNDDNLLKLATVIQRIMNKQIDVMNYTLNQSWNNGGRSELKNSDGCMTTVGIIDMLHENLISVYPNPTSGIVNFKFAMNIKVNSIVIQNVLGEEIVRTEDIQNDIFSMDLSAFPKGVYFAIIDTDKGRSTKKILLSE